MFFKQTISTICATVLLICGAPETFAQSGKQAITCVLDDNGASNTYVVDFDASTVNDQPAAISDRSIAWIIVFGGGLGAQKLDRYAMTTVFEMADWKYLSIDRASTIARLRLIRSPQERMKFVEEMLPPLVAASRATSYGAAPTTEHCQIAKKGI